MTTPLGNAYEDPEAIKERIAQQVRDAEAHAKTANELAQKLKSLEVGAKSPGGEVRVRVSASGILVDLEFDDTALDLPPRSLADAVLQAYQDGQRTAAREAIALTEQELGTDVAGQVRDDYESRLGTLDDEGRQDGDSAGGFSPWTR